MGQQQKAGEIGVQVSLKGRERQQGTAISGHAQPSLTAATSADTSLPREH